MKRSGLGLSLVAACFVSAGISSSALAEKASPVEPSKWLNAKTSMSWDKLKGRVILVEKWATW